MAWYDGETLKDKLRRGPAAIDDAVRIAEQLADALSVAHAAGIVHCDVKPANILLTRSGQVKLVDFGIARLIAEEETQGTAAAGTPAYMSPEQTRGGSCSSGPLCLFYEMLGGRRPFQGK